MATRATNAVQLVKAGRVKGLAVTSTTRLPALLTLPTVAEAGLKDYESSQWYGLLAPAGTPEGLNDGQRVQILTGLAAGDVVVADARRQLSDGARVRATVN